MAPELTEDADGRLTRTSYLAEFGQPVEIHGSSTPSVGLTPDYPCVDLYAVG
ncbi:hypothetical protein ACFRR7_18140 [Streptomyces sp. NPDC056909]|uniref:hypothetical protein n=1 Tax=Streptomyces sp. NPDC056909 TaxID=3345963 RepID=UPI0036859674